VLILGSPEKNNQFRINQIRNITEFSSDVLQIDDNFLSENLDKGMKVLDIGKSLREKSRTVSSLVDKLEILDINVFDDYPDIQMDLCEDLEIPSNLKFDVIFCFSLLEHCYNPFIASKNLFNFLSPNSRIIGSVPFLFPYHCPEDFSYQDYFRFTKDSLIVLFPDASKITINPQRGRVGAGLQIISQRYKDVLEKRLPKFSTFLNRIDLARRPQQTSGFTFIVYN
jgi:hypothetical protein